MGEQIWFQPCMGDWIWSQPFVHNQNWSWWSMSHWFWSWPFMGIWIRSRPWEAEQILIFTICEWCSLIFTIYGLEVILAVYGWSSWMWVMPFVAIFKCQKVAFIKGAQWVLGRITCTSRPWKFCYNHQNCNSSHESIDCYVQRWRHNHS